MIASQDVRALDLGKRGGDRANPSTRSICNPRDLTCRRASAAAVPGLQDHTVGRSTISLLVHNMLVQTIQLYKAYQRPSRPPPRRKTSRASSPLSGGKKPQGGLPIPESGPSSYPPPDPSAIPMNAATALLWRTHLIKESPPRVSIRSDKRNLSSRPHTNCVYPQQ